MDLTKIPAPAGETNPIFSMTPGGAAKVVASVILTTMGMYYLNAGRKESDLSKMIWGAVLILGGTFVFF